MLHCLLLPSKETGETLTGEKAGGWKTRGRERRKEEMPRKEKGGGGNTHIRESKREDTQHTPQQKLMPIKISPGMRRAMVHKISIIPLNVTRGIN